MNDQRIWGQRQDGAQQPERDESPAIVLDTEEYKHAVVPGSAEANIESPDRRNLVLPNAHHPVNDLRSKENVEGKFGLIIPVLKSLASLQYTFF